MLIPESWTFVCSVEVLFENKIQLQKYEKRFLKQSIVLGAELFLNVYKSHSANHSFNFLSTSLTSLLLFL